MPSRIPAGMVRVNRLISAPGAAARRRRWPRTRVTATACPAGPMTITRHSHAGSAAAVLASIRAVDGVTGPSQHRFAGWPDKPARVRQGTVTVSNRVRGSFWGDPRTPGNPLALADVLGQLGAQPGAGASPGSGRSGQLGPVGQGSDGPPGSRLPGPEPSRPPAPGSPEPGSAEAGSAGPGSGGLESSKPGSAGPGSAGPGSSGPGSAGPGSAGPGSGGLESSGPGSAGPRSSGADRPGLDLLGLDRLGYRTGIRGRVPSSSPRNA